jgi:hypothetical protein
MSQKRQPTTLFSAIIRVHEEALLQKCFSERMIDSTVPDGTYLKQLSAAFQQTVTDTFWEHRLAGFRLKMAGRYNPSVDELKPGVRDIVSFEFSYLYDPALIKLHLVRLRATLNNEFQTEYLLHGHPSRELPKSSNVYHDLVTGYWKQLQAALPGDDEDRQETVRMRPGR